MWDDIQPMAGGLAGLGIFGDSASGDVGDDAPLQTRFLDLVGVGPNCQERPNSSDRSGRARCCGRAAPVGRSVGERRL